MVRPMCATCVAQGVTYVGGAVGALQVMRIKARLRRGRDDGDRGPDATEVAASDEATPDTRLKATHPG
jgi:hypothetical protein